MVPWAHRLAPRCREHRLGTSFKGACYLACRIMSASVSQHNRSWRRRPAVAVGVEVEVEVRDEEWKGNENNLNVFIVFL